MAVELGEWVEVSQRPPVEVLAGLREAALAEVGKVVVSHESAIELTLVAALAGGDVLLEGPQGTAKTLLAAAMANPRFAGCDRVLVEDVVALAPHVLAHRIIGDATSSTEIVSQALQQVSRQVGVACCSEPVDCLA